ncbi:zf-HC2 domain-containing protein [Nocardia sp. NBC_01329]|uniref:zf-HC2 domain-containing protein n=1 Tax=Nocardia sp. NBC_01329 TaxID=2903594 RepID=UPI002E0DB142|nr:zf-HC2 domain-containing protein [Nocardia sp. NBC_01329]
MRCETAREAVSALMDGETPAVPARRLGDHLDQCPQCRTWRALAGRAMGATLSGCLPTGAPIEVVAAQSPPESRHRSVSTRFETGATAVHAALALEVFLLVTACGLPASGVAVAVPAAVGISVAIQHAITRRATGREQPNEDELSPLLPPRAVPGQRRPYAAAGTETP